MEQISAPKWSTVISYGLYFGITSIIFSLITYYGGLMGNDFFGLIGYVLFPVFIYLGLKSYKDKENNGFLPYGVGLGIGVLISSVSGVVSAIFTYILFVYVDPAKLNEFIALSQEEVVKGGVSEADLENVKGLMDMVMSPIVLSVAALFGAVVIGLICSLVIAAILKKDPDPTC